MIHGNAKTRVETLVMAMVAMVEIQSLQTDATVSLPMTQGMSWDL